MTLIFVFGTLKRGFPFGDKLNGAKFRGVCRTARAFPMFVAGRVFGPMMLDRPGRGLRVSGELFEVTSEQLATVDEAEGVGQPGSFRKAIDLITAEGDSVSAEAFFKDARIARPRHGGYLQDYQDERFVSPAQRPASMPPLRLLSGS